MSKTPKSPDKSRAEPAAKTSPELAPRPFAAEVSSPETPAPSSDRSAEAAVPSGHSFGEVDVSPGEAWEEPIQASSRGVVPAAGTSFPVAGPGEPRVFGRRPGSPASPFAPIQLVFEGTGDPDPPLVELARLERDEFPSSEMPDGEAEATLVLKKAFGSNWFFAKDVLVFGKWPQPVTDEVGEEEMPEVGEREELMRRLLALRAYVYQEILARVRTQYEGTKEAGGLTGEDLLKWGDAGSQSLTSDIDVNLKGRINEIAVREFNARFLRKGWPYEAGTVFDVNVYAVDFMHGFDVEQGDDPTVGLIEPALEKNLHKGTAVEDARDQEVWSLVKLIRFMDHENEGSKKCTEWQAYKVSLGCGPDVDKEDQPEGLSVKLSMAAVRYDRYRGEMNRALELVEQEAADAGMFVEGLEHYHEDALRLAASNRVYERKLIIVRSARAKIAMLRKSAKEHREARILGASRELRAAISEAALYANEAMITDGAVNMVVVGTQIGGSSEFIGKQQQKGKLGGETTDVKVRLTEAQFLHAFTEQIADAIKEFHHYDDLRQGAYKGGKYLMRALVAADQLSGVPGAGIERYEMWRTLGDTAVALKGEYEGPTSSKEAALGELLRLRFGIDDFADTGSFRALILKFGADVTKAYYQAKSEVVIPEDDGRGSPEEQQAKKQAKKRAELDKVGGLLKDGATRARNMDDLIELLLSNPDVFDQGDDE